MNRRRLYRCTHDRRLAGVASGMAEYFDLDPSLVRILWVVSVFFGGFTLLVYVAMALIVPLEPAWTAGPGPWGPGAGSWGPGAGAWGAPPTANPAADGSGDAAPAGGAPVAEGGPATAAGATGPSGPWWTPEAGPPAGWPAAEPHQHRAGRGLGLGAPFFGMLLIIFGSLALADQFVPGWAPNGHFLWPAFILAAGVLLVVTAVRRKSSEP
jgi:phage shock protein C